jgi:SAM-dependent methyltransferase
LKLGAARARLDYAFLHRFGLTRHGGMEKPGWAMEVFERHYRCVEFHRRSAGFCCLELGPGDSLFTALIARAFGASATWLIDVGPFATRDVELYWRMADELRARGFSAPELSASRSFDEVLRACNATYLTGGLASLRTVPDGCIDFAFSNTVLQHVRRSELAETLRELRRVMHPEGCGVHSLDLRDMLGGSLHHLRFSQLVWESEWFRGAGFYTNRLLLPQWVEAFASAGFSCEVAELNQWPRLPLRRELLAQPYRRMPEDQLRARTLRLVTRPAGNASG